MKKHQEVEWKQFHHVVAMCLLLPIYIVDYNWNTEYYEEGEKKND